MGTIIVSSSGNQGKGTNFAFWSILTCPMPHGHNKWWSPVVNCVEGRERSLSPSWHVIWRETGEVISVGGGFHTQYWGICSGLWEISTKWNFAIFACLAQQYFRKEWRDHSKIWKVNRGVKVSSMTEFRTDRTISSYIKVLAVMAYLGALFLYLQIPEQVGTTQGPKKYCTRWYRWILCT